MLSFDMKHTLYFTLNVATCQSHWERVVSAEIAYKEVFIAFSAPASIFFKKGINFLLVVFFVG